MLRNPLIHGPADKLQDLALSERFLGSQASCEATRPEPRSSCLASPASPASPRLASPYLTPRQSDRVC